MRKSRSGRKPGGFPRRRKKEPFGVKAGRFFLYRAKRRSREGAVRGESRAAFTKTGGIIYGEVTDPTLANTATNGGIGHAVMADPFWLDTTADEQVNMDSGNNDLNVWDYD
jgi:hypothetical protein